MVKNRIEHIDKVIPDAYHGTVFHNAQKIISNNKFVPSDDLDTHLGTGVYFYETAIDLAVWWAKKKSKGSGRYGVLQATVQLGRCLDLIAQENRDKIKFWRSVLVERFKDKKIKLRWVINSYAEEFGADTVRCIYVPPDPQVVEEGSGIYEKVRLVICVRNAENILRISLAESGII
ncbi:MAG: hypothetical protein WC647_03985 [Desulfomonilaceae bacterium]|jgi:hypothetical protein